MGRPALSPEQEAEVRLDILTVARALFTHQGFDAVTMRAVAEGVGCSPMRLYRYYANKRALLRDIWEEVFVQVFDEVTSAVNRADGAEAKLKALAMTYVEYWFAHPDEYRVIFLNEDHVADEDDQYYVNSSTIMERFDIVRALFEEGLSAAVFRGDDPNLMAQQYLCAMHGVAHMVITVPEYPWEDAHKILNGLIQTLLEGYRA
jgi:AcrR family transcriptional regulator